METIQIPTEKLLEEFKEFTPWSGPFLVRILAYDKDSNITAKGSGGLIKYRDRFFTLTNHHVIKDIDKIEDIVIPYTVDETTTFRMTIIKCESSSEGDWAVLEIKYNENIEKGNHRFLDFEYVDLDIVKYSETSNILYLHGYPSGQTTITNNTKKEIDATTLPYCTFIDKYDFFIQSIFAYTTSEVTTEFNTKRRLPVVTGMSGSFVYGYYYGEEIKFKLIGILTNWHMTDERLEIYPIKEFIDFIEEKFF